MKKITIIIAGLLISQVVVAELLDSTTHYHGTFTHKHILPSEGIRHSHKGHNKSIGSTTNNKTTIIVKKKPQEDISIKAHFDQENKEKRAKRNKLFNKAVELENRGEYKKAYEIYVRILDFKTKILDSSYKKGWRIKRNEFGKAKYNLALMDYEGRGVKKNLEKAYNAFIDISLGERAGGTSPTVASKELKKKASFNLAVISCETRKVNCTYAAKEAKKFDLDKDKINRLNRLIERGEVDDEARRKGSRPLGAVFGRIANFVRDINRNSSSSSYIPPSSRTKPNNSYTGNNSQPSNKNYKCNFICYTFDESFGLGMGKKFSSEQFITVIANSKSSANTKSYSIANEACKKLGYFETHSRWGKGATSCRAF